jgi:hypothetical protein
MSHKFKRPARLNPQERRDERAINLMAMGVPDQNALEVLLAGADAITRRAMIERLRPYLSFEPAEVTPDCPACGLRRGSVVPHECLGAN